MTRTGQKLRDPNREKAAAVPLWAPLKRPIYRTLWIASFLSMAGMWMHDAAASWLMTTIAPSPAMVALVQTAMALPMFFLALPTGALADILDRKRILILAQLWMMAMALILGTLTVLGLTTSWTLLALTFCIGIGQAFAWPAFAATVPDLVPRNELLSAITLNGVAANSTRAIGPAIGGALIGIAGTGPIFLLNGVTYLGIIAALARWKKPREKESPLPSERLIGAIRVGLRYASESTTLKRALWRGSMFFFSGVVILALMPLLVRDRLGGGPETFGLMLGAFGVGAVLTAFLLPVVARYASRDQVLNGAQLSFVAGIVALSQAGNLIVAGVAIFVAGVSWLAALATFQVIVQASLPAWVRARGLSIFLMTMMGSMAVGSAFWGLLAREYSIPTSLIVAGCTIVASVVVTFRLSLSGDEDEGDLSPVTTWPDTSMPVPAEGHRGPFEVLVEYDIPPANRQAFVAAMREIRHVRQRNGAYSWALFEDINKAGTFIETFMDDTWHDHLRRRLRLTLGDQAAQERVNALQVTPGPPRIRHLLAEELPRDRPPADNG